MPHIYPLDSEQGYPRIGNGHMSARCTRSLRSSLHYEQEMVQLNSFNRSESLSLRNSPILSGGMAQEMNEVIRELSQSPPGYPLTMVESQNESGGVSDRGQVSAGGILGSEFLHLDNFEQAPNLNSDSGSEVLHFSTTTDTYPLREWDQEVLTSSQDSGAPLAANTHELPVATTRLEPLTESS